MATKMLIAAPSERQNEPFSAPSETDFGSKLRNIGISCRLVKHKWVNCQAPHSIRTFSAFLLWPRAEHPAIMV
jgi:hypothetical protein